MPTMQQERSDDAPVVKANRVATSFRRIALGAAVGLALCAIGAVMSWEYSHTLWISEYPDYSFYLEKLSWLCVETNGHQLSEQEAIALWDNVEFSHPELRFGTVDVSGCGRSYRIVRGSEPGSYECSSHVDGVWAHRTIFDRGTDREISHDLGLGTRPRAPGTEAILIAGWRGKDVHDHLGEPGTKRSEPAVPTKPQPEHDETWEYVAADGGHITVYFRQGTVVEAIRTRSTHRSSD